MGNIKAVYANYGWVKAAVLAGLLLCGILLYTFSGGMPPSPWRFLWLVLPQIPQLWAVHGTAILLPLFGLLLWSISLLIMWVLILSLLIEVAKSWWRAFHDRQDFNQDLLEAELLSEEGFEAHAQLSVATQDSKTSGPFDALSEAADTDRQFDALSQTSSTRVVVPPARNSQPTEQLAVMPITASQQAYGRSRVSRISGGVRVYEQAVASAGSTSPWSAASHPIDDASVPLSEDRNQPTATSNLSGSASTKSIRKQLRLVPTQHEEISDLYEEDVPPGVKMARNAYLLPAQATLPPIPDTDTQPPLEELELEDDFDVANDNTNNDDIANRNTIPGEIEDLYDDDDGLGELATLPGLNEKHDTHPHAWLLPKAKNVLTRLIVGIGLDPGIARKNHPNEDSLFAIQGMRMTDDGSTPAGLFVVADGMGGHVNGREASRQAIHTISDIIVPALLRDVNERSLEDENNIFSNMLKDGVHRANLAIYRRNREQPEMMGTTLTAALIVNTTAYVVNVGDSRTYLYRASEGLTQITRDHSMVARLVEVGTISREDIYTHPQRNQIYRCLGEHAAVDIDTFVVPLQADDILLLCSDGLWEMVRDGALEKIIAASTHNPAQISSILVQAALSRGGADNISVVVVGIVKTED